MYKIIDPVGIIEQRKLFAFGSSNLDDRDISPSLRHLVFCDCYNLKTDRASGDLVYPGPEYFEELPKRGFIKSIQLDDVVEAKDVYSQEPMLSVAEYQTNTEMFYVFEQKKEFRINWKNIQLYLKRSQREGEIVEKSQTKLLSLVQRVIDENGHGSASVYKTMIDNK